MLIASNYRGAPQMEPDKVIEKLVAYLLDHKPDDPVRKERYNIASRSHT
jgi:hypothetical protein